MLWPRKKTSEWEKQRQPLIFQTDMSEASILKVHCQGAKDAFVKWYGCYISKSLC